MKFKNITIIVLFIILILSGCTNSTYDSNYNNSEKQVSTTTNNNTSNNFKISFIDVGQGDSILINSDNNFMLIDAGEEEYKDRVLQYLRKNNVTKLSYVIGTHPHSDHIGGLDYIIQNIQTDKVYLPYIEKYNKETKEFEELYNVIKNKKLNIVNPKVGDTFILGESKCTILAPNSSFYEDLNNYSIVLRVEYGKTSFLLTGDAQSLSEEEMLKSGLNLKSDVLKLGHHGSYTSTSEVFLSHISPKHGIISVGKNNYGHPSSLTLDKLQKFNVNTYRTDINGTITITSDGHNLYVNEDTITMQQNTSNYKDVSKNSEENEYKFIGNKNTNIFHKNTCSLLPKQNNRIYFDSREEAIKENYKPCKTCNP